MPSAFVIIHCDPAETYYVIRNLKYIPEVKTADDVFGYYEVVCKVEASTQKELEKIITNSIRKVQHIISTMTLTVIDGQG
ncbi:Lrp/AsnC ligand binding domain-containing protein [Candidatus Nitrosotenuis cloacae]|uniref:Lrp/AsnC ligand binding domain-containing protein n=1 Tax=Candidatus Nitrosotenuis cloacae TaxID=1603555 RepID=UPI0022814D85|nr:Lrp/AsnC ligand binding domain-containing protein [Candidatus Nitrosotenuis cloacae]